MAFDFPNSPTTGQQFTPLAGVTYQWNGYAWDLVTQGTVLASGVVQQVYAENTSYLSGGWGMAGVNDSVPQQTDGGQILTATITPKSISNTLHVDIIVPITANAAASLWLGLFQDSTAAALASNYQFMAGANNNEIMTLSYEFPAGTVSPTTFKVRCGQLSNGAATVTTYVNGTSAARILGGSQRATLVVTEISPLVSPSPTFTGGNVLLATRTASNQASVDFISLMDGTYDEYEVHFFGVQPVANGDQLVLRVGEGGVILSTGSYYSSGLSISGSAGFLAIQINGTGTSMALTAAGSASNAAGGSLAGKVTISRPADIGKIKQLRWETAALSVVPSALPSFGNGWWNADTNAIDSLRFLFNGGNISTGTFKLYGVR